ncbi:rab-GTPase-TBC domain-containing protein, partial [Pelagophyceae sp. CCMP2097]
LAELWRPGMPQLKLRVFQFDRLVCLRLPRLRAHLKEVGLAPDVLASQWFLTLFAYALPTHWLKRVWDCVFAGGWAAIYKIALARLTL